MHPFKMIHDAIWTIETNQSCHNHDCLKNKIETFNLLTRQKYGQNWTKSTNSKIWTKLDNMDYEKSLEKCTKLDNLDIIRIM